jgi:colanic acid biosynthesis glycosyl transferase WcaI
MPGGQDTGGSRGRKCYLRDLPNMSRAHGMRVAMPKTDGSQMAHQIVMVRAYFTARPDALVRVMAELGEGLINAGCTVNVLAMSETRSRSNFLAQYPSVTEISLRPVNCLGPRKLRSATRQAWFLVAATGWLIRHRQDVDTLITVDTPSGIGVVGRLMRWLTGGRINHINWVMDLFYSQSTNANVGRLVGWITRQMRHLEFFGLRGSSPVVVLGECMRELLQRNGVSAPIHVIPLWATDDLIESERVNDSETHLRTVFYGGHAAARNPLFPVIEAAKYFAERGVRFEIIGAGSEIDSLRTRIQRESVHNVHVTSTLGSLEYARRAGLADIHLVSLDAAITGSGVPSKTYAAMAVSKPIVYMGSAVGQAARDVISANAGHVIPHSGAALTKVLIDMLRDEGLLRELGKNGRVFLLRERTRCRGTDRWLALLDSVAGAVGTERAGIG